MGRSSTWTIIAQPSRIGCSLECVERGEGGKEKKKRKEVFVRPVIWRRRLFLRCPKKKGGGEKKEGKGGKTSKCSQPVSTLRLPFL